MKLSENYILKTVAGTPVVVPVGDAVKDLNGMITLNGSAEFIWKMLENGAERPEILAALKAEYNADEKILAEDLDYFINKLVERKILAL